MAHPPVEVEVKVSALILKGDTYSADLMHNKVSNTYLLHNN